MLVADKAFYLGPKINVAPHMDPFPITIILCKLQP